LHGGRGCAKSPEAISLVCPRADAPTRIARSRSVSTPAGDRPLAIGLNGVSRDRPLAIGLNGVSRDRPLAIGLNGVSR